ncbi:hypothetical protein FLGE108171_14585 [Flavobacterium gelidilacus]|uniref:hypothetical protein n=1 Tax=Flavobacterium gelidilacus TaxID=206041 RepID=UPI000428420A|nr:hypothetical protein [Flavobacterium gelidilacus]
MNQNQKKLLSKLGELFQVEYIKNTREGLIAAISNMDLEAIAKVLDDEGTYQDTTKTIYLEKLREGFDQFRKGDDFLIPYEGGCISEECNNKTKKGVAFVGNNTGRHLTLIIELFEKETIKDIYHCYSFCPNNFELDENARNINCRVYSDEKVYFNKSATFIKNNSQAVRAINELKRYENQVINGDILKNWQNKHKDLYDNLVWTMQYKNLDEFAKYFSDISTLVEYLKCEEEAATSIQEYNNLDLSNEINLLHWLIKYENLYHNLILLPGETITEKGLEASKEKLHKNLNVYFDTNIFKNALYFIDLFFDKHSVKFKKYNTLTAQEWDDLVPFSDEYQKLSGLEYHLKKRGIL